VLAGLAVLACFAADARAQRVPFYGMRGPITTQPTFSPFINPIDRNPFIAPGLTLQQAAFNTAVLGRAASNVPPWVAGFNPYTPPVITSGPVIPGAGGGYAPGLSTGSSPFSPGLATDPYGSSSDYSLSTTGGAGGYASPWGLGAGGYGGYGSLYTPAQGALYGQAALTSATADFYSKIMQAKLTQEELRRSRIQTARERFKWEQEYEAMRPGLQDYREKQMALDMRIARGDAPVSSIVSGRALNDLLKSINAPGRSLNRGTTIPLDEDLLKHITVTGPTSNGNVGLLKNEKALTSWPRALEDDRFKEARQRLTDNLRVAVGRLKDPGGRLERGLMKTVEDDLTALNNQLAASTEEMSPAQYIEARQHLNRLRDAVRALGDPRVANYFNNTWSARGRNVSELADHMKTAGLRFGPAAPGEEESYDALYQALRAFEASLQTASRTRE